MTKSFKIIVLCLLSFKLYAYDDMTVLSLNDFHGQVEANKNMVEAAKIASNKIKSLGNKSEIEGVTAGVKGASGGVFQGPNHQYVNGLRNGTTVVQGASQGKDISRLHYDCHTNIDKCVATPGVINLAKATKYLPTDKNVVTIISKYKDSIKDELNKVVSKASKPLSNQPQDTNYNIPLT